MALHTVRRGSNIISFSSFASIVFIEESEIHFAAGYHQTHQHGENRE